MKKKIFTLFAVIGTAVLFYFSVSAFKNVTEKPVKENAVETASSVRDTFTNCIFNSSFEEINSEKWRLGDKLHVSANLVNYNELNFNAVHSYDEKGSDIYGDPNVPVLSTSQINNYKSFLDSVKEQGNLTGFFERSFISKYCYGQRLRYEVAPENGNQTLNFGFVYQTRERGSYETDEGRTVVHAVPATYPMAGYLCRDIYENLQHSDLFDFRQKDTGTWHIKPVMKIPQNTSPSTRVVRIDVVAFNGNIVRQIEIDAGNFTGSGYNENYIYLTTPLTISGKDEPGALNYGRGPEEGWKLWDTSCHVDFRVYWYGECEVWFDKMIVDDDAADRLFDVNYQTTFINPRIHDEVTSFTNHGSLNAFFMDEVCISQYPCLQYIADKMREYKPESKLSIAVTNSLHIHGLKNDALSFSVYPDSVKPYFIQDDHHGFYYNNPHLPSTIQISDSRVPEAWRASSNDIYNHELQNVIGVKNEVGVENETGSLIKILSKLQPLRFLI